MCDCLLAELNKHNSKLLHIPSKHLKLCISAECHDSDHRLQVSIKKTKPTYSSPPSNTLNEAQVSVLERLVTEDPYVWDPPSLAALFEVKERDVIDNIEVGTVRYARNKEETKEKLYKFKKPSPPTSSEIIVF